MPVNFACRSKFSGDYSVPVVGATDMAHWRAGAFIFRHWFRALKLLVID